MKKIYDQNLKNIDSEHSKWWIYFKISLFHETAGSLNKTLAAVSSYLVHVHK